MGVECRRYSLQQPNIVTVFRGLSLGNGVCLSSLLLTLKTFDCGWHEGDGVWWFEWMSFSPTAASIGFNAMLEPLVASHYIPQNPWSPKAHQRKSGNIVHAKMDSVKVSKKKRLVMRRMSCLEYLFPKSWKGSIIKMTRWFESMSSYPTVFTSIDHRYKECSLWFDALIYPTRLLLPFRCWCIWRNRLAWGSVSWNPSNRHFMDMNESDETKST